MALELEWVNWQADCVARHIGLWLIEPGWFGGAVSAVKAGLWQPPKKRALISSDSGEPEAKANQVDSRPQFMTDGAGIAVVPIDGQMMKGSSKYGGANTVDIRRQVRAAARDPEVRAIMLAIDSPGGTVAGTQELAVDVAEANKKKPVYAHGDSLIASAAYWVASQASRITASPTTEIGSIGTLAVVEDYSAQAEKKGVKVHVISTGPYKGAGVEGTPITPDHLAYIQDRVNAINAHFLEAVSNGRNQPLATVQDWADGRVWGEGKAKQMGLIDGVMSFDQAMTAARADLDLMDKQAAQSAPKAEDSPLLAENGKPELSEEAAKALVAAEARRERVRKAIAEVQSGQKK